MAEAIIPGQVNPPAPAVPGAGPQLPAAPQPTGAMDEFAQTLAQGQLSVQDIIAPPSIDIDFNHLKIGETFVRTLFV
ncbi:MAG: hypothetical protein UY40_C0003G0025, partial [candidate division CPR1 bacterium GW2011_GWC1_49_13]